MNTKEQASQLRLAAGIIETGHPYEIDDNAGGGFRKPLTGENPGKVAFINGRIRIILATPPDGRALHNPNNLTAEQVGVGYRLGLVGEPANVETEKQEFWSGGSWVKSGEVYSKTLDADPNSKTTYRLPLSVPWPELPDQYAELKAAHKEGRVIEGLIGGHWILCSRPTWEYPVETYRIKPEPGPFHLPTPPPGIQWHRTDGWKAGDLPQGYRPLASGERFIAWDQIAHGGEENKWELIEDVTSITSAALHADKYTRCSRTTRPLEFQHLGKTWTWHKAGDPMPCERARTIHVLFYNGKSYSSSVFGSDAFHWGPDSICVGWRYADPATKTVDLGPEDVPPGSVFRCSQWSYSKCWLNVRSVRDNGVELTNDFGWVTWHNLAEGFQINRPANRDADGYPTKWEPCSKEVPA